MNSDNQSNENLDELTKDELIKQVRQLRFEVRGEEHLTKRDILTQLQSFEELGLEDEDLMDVQQEYNMGLRKSGWMKIYNFVQDRASDQS